MKFIEALYSSDLPADVHPASYWQERGDIDRLRELRTEELLAGLTDPQKKLLETIERCFTETAAVEERYGFIAGFRLGVRIMSECIADDN